MSNRYLQIALTYTRQRLFWLATLPLLFFMTAIVFTFSGHASAGKQIDNAPIPIVFYPLGVCFGGVVMHLKAQLASPRARLFPRYRVPHLLVAGVMALPVVAAFPLIMTAAYHAPLVPALAINALIYACVAWIAYYNGTVARGTFIAVAVASTLPGARSFWITFLTHDSVLLSMMFLTLATVSIVVLIARMLNLNEEMPEYSKTISSAWDRNYLKRASQQRGLVRDSAIDRLSRFSTPGLWQRLYRWELGSPFARSWLQMTGMVALYTFFILKTGVHAGDRLLWPMLVMPPAVAVVISINFRRGMLGYELLRPVARGQFLIEQGLVVFMLMVKYWLAAITGALAVVALIDRQELLSPDFWSPMLFTLLLVCPVCALLLWLARAVSPAVFRYAVAPVAMACFMLVFHLNEGLPVGRFPTEMFAIAGTSAAGITMLILWIAYRQWLRTDLG